MCRYQLLIEGLHNIERPGNDINSMFSVISKYDGIAESSEN